LTRVGSPTFSAVREGGAPQNKGQFRIDIENDHADGLLQCPDEGNGLGLANTRTRLEKLYGEQSRPVSTNPGHLAEKYLGFPQGED